MIIGTGITKIAEKKVVVEIKNIRFMMTETKRGIEIYVEQGSIKQEAFDRVLIRA